MALTYRRKLELAVLLSKLVHTAATRLGRKPRARHRVRNSLLVAGGLAAGAVAAAVASRRLGCYGDRTVRSPEHAMPSADSGPEGIAEGADALRDTQAFVPA